MENLTKRCRRMGMLLALAAALLAPTPALAQREASPEALAAAKKGKAYVTQYALVVMCAALGFVVVCKPSKRTDKVKQEEDA